MKIDTYRPKIGPAAPRDPRIGRTLYDVLREDAMLAAIRTAIAAESGPDSVPSHLVLTALAQRQFDAMTITALSYSPKKRRYQVAVRIDGPKPRGATFHMPQSAFLDDGQA